MNMIYILIMDSLFGLLFIVFIGLCAWGFIWFVKETWNDTGMSDEKFERLFKRKRNGN